MRTIWAEDKRRRRAALKHSIPYLDDSSFSEVIKAFNGACAYCGSTDKLYQDHFYPVGTSRPNNAILPTCAKCNSSKNNHEFTEWFPKQTFYSSDRAAAIYRFLFEQRAT
jgi:5-methylcytosine-specific restriction endonuclease McrA